MQLPQGTGKDASRSLSTKCCIKKSWSGIQKVLAKIYFSFLGVGVFYHKSDHYFFDWRVVDKSSLL